MSLSKDINNYDVDAANYSKLDIKGQGTIYLSFRDIHHLIKRYIQTNKPWEECKCIDYGCGAGRSTRFLKSIGFPDVDGFDISQTMLNDAKKFDPSGHYVLIQSAKVPAPNNFYDLALASFVFVEMGNKDDIENVFKEIHRILKPQGIFIIVTTSSDLYNPSYNWLSYKINTEIPIHNSGDAIPLKITDINLELADYLWTDKDYKDWAQEVGMTILTKDNPKGKLTDDIAWASEKKVSPYAIYVLRNMS